MVEFTINLSTGERKFWMELRNTFGFDSFIQLKDIKQSFPKINSNVLLVYLSQLKKKGFIFKIKRGLYYLPQITFGYRPLTIQGLTSHLKFKHPIKINEDWDNQILWIGYHKEDKDKLPEFRRMFRYVVKNIKNNDVQEGFVNLKYIKFIQKQKVSPPRAIHWTKFFDAEVKKQKTEVKEVEPKIKERDDTTWDLD